MSQAEAAMAVAQVRIIEARAYAEDGTLIHPQLLDRYQRRVKASANYAGDEEQYTPALRAHFTLILEAVTAGRAELLRLHRAGEIDDRTLHELERDLDLEELGATSAMGT
jgi:CPA1 family monovalent cation:H+ antiporter